MGAEASKVTAMLASPPNRPERDSGAPYRIEKVPGMFREGQLAKRYNIILNLEGARLPKQIVMPVWCGHEMDMEAFLKQDKKPDTYLLLSGLLASPDQFHWPELSVIENLTEAIKKKRIQRASKLGQEAPPFDPVYFGMAGPGFDGSEVTPDPKAKIDPRRVSVETYDEIVNQAEAKLKLGPEVSYVGHSAGAAEVLLHRSKERLPGRRYVALHPAIQIDKATQFIFMKFLLSFIPPLQNLDKVINTNIAEVMAKNVVRILNGYTDTIKTTADLFRFFVGQDFKDLPPQVQKQIMLHVNEIFKHLNAAIAKTIDLQRPHERGEHNTRTFSLIITGEDDLITFVEDIIGKYYAVNIFEGAHHDDFFTNPEIQAKYINLIAEYLVTGHKPETPMNVRITPTKLRARLKKLGNIMEKLDPSLKKSHFPQSRVG